MAEPHRAGVVALLGRPNAGKSTLLNRILGEKLAIVTARPQTTRSRILGIWSRPDAQLLLLDTPGFHRSEKALNKALIEIVDEVADDCDVALLLIDPRRGADPGHEELAARLARAGTPILVVFTQCDLPGSEAGAELPASLAELPSLCTSGRTGKGVDELLDAVVARLPEAPAFYPEDELTDRPLRFLVAELVREAAFEALEQEVPYGLAVEVRSFDEGREDLVRIACDLLVERKSQKGIVLGRGGSMIKRIGIAARQQIEALLGRRVHLELWVKVDPRWAKRPGRLRALGYH